MDKLPSIVSLEEFSQIFEKEKVIVFDATNGGKESYDKEHIRGAHFIDLNGQLSDIKTDPAEGGRHPLPSPEKFARVLSEYGVSKESHIIIYDNNKGANAAARFWWMLKAAGHKKVQVLNGGINDAKMINIPVGINKEEVIQQSTLYQFENWTLPTVTKEEVKEFSKDQKFVVIDVRDESRYAGKTEPIDLIAGHIPGAKNIPYSENLDQKGHFLSPQEINEKYVSKLAGYEPENIIIHCGSGVTACHTILALDYAGFGIPMLYVGSWSEWSRNFPEETEVSPN